MDNYRPRYHFRPEKNWMNDPNGPIYYQGEYHLFFQYNPEGDEWGTIHWGHAKSKDLIHWEECGIALFPDQSLNEVHCYSGCAFLDGNLPTIYYTSVGEGERGPMEGALQWAAVSHDDMLTWRKKKAPALDRRLHEEHGVHIAMWRDPFVWSEKDGYYALLGGTLLDKSAESMEDVQAGKGCLALYYSKDLRGWEFKSILFQSERYYLLECPNMIPFGERYLLLYSPLDAVRFCIGTLDKKTWEFHISAEGIFDHSILKKGFYAPNTYLNDPAGRKIVIGWISEADRNALSGIKGWAGMQSIPRKVWLENNKVRVSPVEEIRLLRKKMLYDMKRSGPQKSFPQEKWLAAGKALELSLCAVCGEKAGVELSVFADNAGRERTRICYDMKKNTVSIRRECSSLWADSETETVEAFMDGTEGDEISLLVYLDYSVIEVYVNESVTLTARVYPSLEESENVYVRTEGGSIIKDMEIWELSL